MHGHCVVLWNKAVEDIMLCMRNGILMDIAMYITVVDVMVRKRGGWQVSEAAGAGTAENRIASTSVPQKLEGGTAHAAQRIRGGVDGVHTQHMCPATGMEGSPAAAKIARQLTADKSNVKRKPSPH